MAAKSKPKTTTRAGLDSAIWSVCDILRRSNCAGALQYVPELTWILFLRILDQAEEVEATKAKAVGADFRPALAGPYRWRDWAAPDAAVRKRMVESASNAFYDFVNTRLIPHLKTLKDRPNAPPRQKVMSEIMSSVETCNLWCVLSLPGGVFTATGAGVKTNVLFFTKGKPTDKIWHFDLSDVKVAKKTPFTRQQLAEFFELLPTRAEGRHSWTIDIAARRRNAKQKANARTEEDTRSPAELIEIIRNKGREVQEILGKLEKL